MVSILSWKNKLSPKKPSFRNLDWYLVSGITFLVVVVLVFGGAAWKLYLTLNDAESLPTESIVVNGKRNFVSDEEIRSAMENLLEHAFFNIDVNDVQQTLESLPWVDKASVRRVWPAKFKIFIQEQQPVARWNNDEWLNLRGETFKAIAPDKEKEFLEQLPYLYGPTSMAEEVFKNYVNMNELLRINGFSLKKLTFNSRHSWRAVLGNGILLELGREDKMARIQRFISIYPSLIQQHRQIANVDLRYDTGLAVGWEDTAERAIN